MQDNAQQSSLIDQYNEANEFLDWAENNHYIHSGQPQYVERDSQFVRGSVRGTLLDIASEIDKEIGGREYVDILGNGAIDTFLSNSVSKIGVFKKYIARDKARLVLAAKTKEALAKKVTEMDGNELLLVLREAARLSNQPD